MRGEQGSNARARAAACAILILLAGGTFAGGLFSRTNVSAAGRLYERLAQFPFEMSPIPGQDPAVKNRFRHVRVEPNTLAPELYADKLAAQFLLVNLPGANDPASYWEGSYQLYFVSEAEERRALDEKMKRLAPQGGAVAFDLDPAEFKEKILLSEGHFKKTGLATPQERVYRVENIAFKERVPEAQRTKGAKLMTVYTVRVFDARLKMPVYHSGLWMTLPFDTDAGDKPVPRTIVYSNFMVSPKGDMFSSQWARDNIADTNW